MVKYDKINLAKNISRNSLCFLNELEIHGTFNRAKAAFNPRFMLI
ncbi:unnamed protein product [Moneuplotes crassus]|uniref:Uncharacterized protein n=1 Tax=Euplotes crassus TaxID=5936 RepID=A0AAD1Y6A7_EUPCR|nr:unnamed protein product [Moneuplotes crassus]